MDVLWETLGFASKALVVFFTFAACTLLLFARARPRRGAQAPGELTVRRLNDSLRAAAEALRGAMMTPKDFKRHSKALVKADKQAERPAANVFVLDFKGDMMATAVDELREEITALLSVANGERDEVVVRLESAGGAAHNYGLAASQLARLGQGGIRLVVCVDRVAASGGYMMACVADHIIAAPFAIVGSIGVAAPVPNLHRLLDRVGVDYENVTAGKYKRTVSVLAKITDQGRQKFQEQIEDVHQLFKNHVADNRPSLDIEEVATGEYWHGLRAAELGLVNELMTSDDYLLSKINDASIYRVSYERKRSVRERLAATVSASGGQLVDTLSERLTSLPQA